jgi:hypothetical protein
MQQHQTAAPPIACPESCNAPGNLGEGAQKLDEFARSGKTVAQFPEGD